MLVFGEIVAFETPAFDRSIDENANMLVIFSSPGQPKEATIVSQGTIIKSAGSLPRKVFGFNRPFTKEHGEKLIVEVILCRRSGAQSLVGYGYCDLVLNDAAHSEDILIPLWRPKTESEYANKLRGVFCPLADTSVVPCLDQFEGSEMSTVSALGKVKVSIHRPSYS
jgi:hypothetical protein